MIIILFTETGHLHGKMTHRKSSFAWKLVGFAQAIAITACEKIHAKLFTHLLYSYITGNIN